MDGSVGFCAFFRKSNRLYISSLLSLSSFCGPNVLSVSEEASLDCSSDGISTVLSMVVFRTSVHSFVCDNYPYELAVWPSDRDYSRMLVTDT